ncbi:MAG TPA: hypothetical protein VIG30_08675 [Ktedonobacterales bacterium]
MRRADQPRRDAGQQGALQRVLRFKIERRGPTRGGLVHDGKIGTAAQVAWLGTRAAQHPHHITCRLERAGHCGVAFDQSHHANHRRRQNGLAKALVV